MSQNEELILAEEVKEEPGPSDALFEDMLRAVRPELEKIDRIREVLGNKGENLIELPTIVCIGN